MHKAYLWEVKICNYRQNHKGGFKKWLKSRKTCKIANPLRVKLLQLHRLVQRLVKQVSTSWDSLKSLTLITADQAGMIIPVVITVYEDKSFDFVTKTPPAAVL